MKKIASLTLVTLLLLAGCSTTGTVTPSPAPQQTPAPAPAPQIPPPQNPTPAPKPSETQQESSLQVYHNSQYKFIFKYPDNFSFNTPIYSNLNEQIVQLGLSEKGYEKTNFGDAAFTVSVQYMDSENKCLTTTLPEGIEKLSTSKIINETKFYTAQGEGAAAGNRYNTRTYRAFVNSNCFEVNETIHTSNIGNYDPGTVTEVDQDKVFLQMENIMSTFTFSHEEKNN